MASDVTLLKKKYASMKDASQARLADFEKVFEEGSEEDIFKELVFCLFTPQSKALSCWGAVEDLTERDLIIKGRADEIAETIPCVRFRNNKARYLVRAREMFTQDGRINVKSKLEGFKDPTDTREWLVKNVKGMGYKEASHFLRNIGKGKDLAILDRHILKNLVLLGVIEEVPASISKNKYLEIEERMANFAREVGIPMSHMDILFWHNETGEIFK